MLLFEYNYVVGALSVQLYTANPQRVYEAVDVSPAVFVDIDDLLDVSVRQIAVAGHKRCVQFVGNCRDERINRGQIRAFRADLVGNLRCTDSRRLVDLDDSSPSEFRAGVFDLCGSTAVNRPKQIFSVDSVPE